MAAAVPAAAVAAYLKVLFHVFALFDYGEAAAWLAGQKGAAGICNGLLLTPAFVRTI